MPFSTLPSFDKVAKKIAIFSLLPKFDNYIRNLAKILTSYQNFSNYAKILSLPKFGKVFFGIKVNRPINFQLSRYIVPMSIKLSILAWTKHTLNLCLFSVFHSVSVIATAISRSEGCGGGPNCIFCKPQYLCLVLLGTLCTVNYRLCAVNCRLFTHHHWSSANAMWNVNRSIPAVLSSIYRSNW